MFNFQHEVRKVNYPTLPVQGLITEIKTLLEILKIQVNFSGLSVNVATSVQRFMTVVRVSSG